MHHGSHHDTLTETAINHGNLLAALKRQAGESPAAAMWRAHLAAVNAPVERRPHIPADWTETTPAPQGFRVLDAGHPLIAGRGEADPATYMEDHIGSVWVVSRCAESFDGWRVDNYRTTPRWWPRRVRDLAGRWAAEVLADAA